MATKTMFKVVVTFGQIPNCVYARTDKWEDARKLKVAALRHKYLDARIETYEVSVQDGYHAPGVKEAKDSQCRGKGDSPVAHRGSRRMHDLPKLAATA